MNYSKKCTKILTFVSSTKQSLGLFAVFRNFCRIHKKIMIFGGHLCQLARLLITHLGRWALNKSCWHWEVGNMVGPALSIRSGALTENSLCSLTCAQRHCCSDQKDLIPKIHIGQINIMSPNKGGTDFQQILSASYSPVSYRARRRS